MNVAKNAALISRIVSSIPERTVRSLSGTSFSLEGARACSDPARLVNVARLLQWLSPLSPLSGEDQRALGLNGPGIRSSHVAEADDLEPAGDEPSIEETLL
jgi:hypothetical protein